MRNVYVLTAFWLTLGLQNSANANQDDLQKRIKALEREVRELKSGSGYHQRQVEESQFPEKANQRLISQNLDQDQLGISDQLPKWIERFRLSGNADVVYFKGQDNSHSPDSRFAVDNARFFFDFDISDQASFYFEWDLVREFSSKNQVGQAYIRYDQLFDVEALNLKLGRVPIPFGEEYLRFHEQRFDNPLISFSAPAPYNWDEGIELFGSVYNNRLDYILAVTDGDDDFNKNTNEVVQVAGKISYRPFSWARLSLSALDTGRLGKSNDAGKSAIEFGGSHAYPFGFGTDVVSYQDGIPISDNTNQEISVTAWEVDAVLNPSDWGQVWLAYGQVGIDSEGSSKFDRDLLYWIAEGIFELQKLSKQLTNYYLAARYSAIGTFDSGEGYMLAAMNDGKNLGYNTKDVHVISAGLGVRLHDNIKVKLEYSWFDFNLVKGVTSDIKNKANDRDLLGVGISAQF